MIQHKLYNHITELLSNQFCKTWPDEAFSCASWTDIAANIETIYKAQKEAKNRLPQHVRIGYVDDSIHSGELISISGTPENLQIPLLFAWSSYRGLVLYGDDLDSDGDVAPLSIVNQIAGCMLLRLILQSDSSEILIHKIDLKQYCKHMGYLPQQPGRAIITTKENINNLINELDNQIAQHPVDNTTWRCDAGDAAFASDFKPLQIVLISNWDDLYDVRNASKELSEVQNRILDMLSSDIPARNGIYFFICGEKNNISKQFGHLLPILAVDDCNYEGATDERGYCAQLYSNVAPDKKLSSGYSLKGKTFNCRFSLPTENEIQTIQKTHRNYLSGALSDTEGQGVWLGDSTKGLRAIMGVTPQGENQFFELGVGQAYNAFHALIGGATGSGKSVLLSEIICSLAERYSPNELRMLLLDYKEGTEFAPFAKLPHVYALSVGSNAEFGLEVLKEVQKEFGQRGALFKEVSAKNLEEYRTLTGKTLCRYVLVVDEFRVLLGDKKYGAEAKMVLNDLVLRGRSFGFHAILATQTLRDGCLDGEAKNQFGCRIAMSMDESETNLFLADGNTVPTTFNRKGRALVNYALGRMESNIIFQSGNKNMPKKFRDTPEVLDCVNAMHKKAVSENCLPTDVYIYSSDGFEEVPQCDIDAAAGVLVGLRNNMQRTPVYISQRQLVAKVLILGGTEEKRNILLNNLCAQLSSVYNEQIRIQTPADYLENLTTGQVTIFNVPEGDFDLKDAITEWNAAGEQALMGDMSLLQPEMPAFNVPEGTESEYEEMMQSLLKNNVMNRAAQAPATRRDRNRNSRCLIIAVGTAADIKLMGEHASTRMYEDFGTVIYLDNIIYNQVSGKYEHTALGEAEALLESSKDFVSKIRLIK